MEHQNVAIIGAGTMGAGIAQVAALHNWNALLNDVDEATTRKALDGIRAQLARLVEKGKLTADQRDAAASRLRAVVDRSDLKDCDLLIEAIVENMDIKSRVLRDLIPALKGDAIIATNTSSLSVTKLGEAIGKPQRTVGMHFFNPAPILPLVEIIRGERTDAAVADRAAAIATSWGKTVVRAKDTPGFIVNRVARPYYLESWRILEDGYATVDQIDRTMRELGGFKMGPFELTDMIGQDINTASSRSVWEQIGKPARLAPSKMQEQLVKEGRLGRKTGRGAYSYAGETPQVDVVTPRHPRAPSPQLQNAVEAFINAAGIGAATFEQHFILARVLVAVINECAHAADEGIATPADIDIALKLATSYPRGPLEWARTIGHRTCAALLLALNATVDDDRFKPTRLLLT
jgi:3-hydroxybutyryl-CoA dehydrogenase